VFYIDVAKVDWDVAHLAMAIHICLKCMYKIFYLFRTYVASVSFGCCKSRCGCCIYMQVFQVFSYICYMCFIWMFAHVCNGYTRVFKFFLMFYKCFSYFEHMLQVFYLDIAKVDRVLHMLQWDPPAVAAYCSC
jgi:hypothetical protein